MITSVFSLKLCKKKNLTKIYIFYIILIVAVLDIILGVHKFSELGASENNFYLIRIAAVCTSG